MMRPNEALHRLERKGWASANWEIPKSGKRECKFYRLTQASKMQLAAEGPKWRLLVRSIGPVMGPAEEG